LLLEPDVLACCAVLPCRHDHCCCVIICCAACSAASTCAARCSAVLHCLWLPASSGSAACLRPGTMAPMMSSWQAAARQSKMEVGTVARAGGLAGMACSTLEVAVVAGDV
jgi:hypothetical protein